MEDRGSSAAASLSEREIRKELRSQALQHPATILPFAVAALCFVYLLIFPFWIISPLLAMILLIVSGFVAVGSFVWIYSIRHDIEYAKLVQKIMALQLMESQDLDRAELTAKRDALRTGFSEVGSNTGLKALNNLANEFEQLQLILESQDDTAFLSLANIPGLAEETYRQGLNVLASSLQLSRTIHSSDKTKLEEALVELKKELDALREDESQAGLVKIKEATVASREELLELLKQQQLRVDELFYQCDRCNYSLTRTRIELAALQAGASETGVNAVTETLQRTIDQAKEVQEEMKRLGF